MTVAFVIAIIILIGAIFYIVRIRSQLSGIRKDESRKIEDRRSSFISIISHQLRTPLSIIRGYLEALLTGDQGGLNDGQKEYVSEALEINKETIQLVNHYLEVVRLDREELTVHPEPVDLVAIIKREVEKLAPLARASNCEIEFKEPKKELSKVLADSYKMKQVIENILTNAIKYSGGRGKATINLEDDGDFILFRSEDNGVGIPADQREEVFTKFFRGENVIHKDTQGSGLGLYVAKTFINAQGGDIWLDSQVNKGTTVYFKLPKAT